MCVLCSIKNFQNINKWYDIVVVSPKQTMNLLTQHDFKLPVIRF